MLHKMQPLVIDARCVHLTEYPVLVCANAGFRSITTEKKTCPKNRWVPGHWNHSIGLLPPCQGGWTPFPRTCAPSPQKGARFPNPSFCWAPATPGFSVGAMVLVTLGIGGCFGSQSGHQPVPGAGRRRPAPPALASPQPPSTTTYCGRGASAGAAPSAAMTMQSGRAACGETRRQGLGGGGGPPG